MIILHYTLGFAPHRSGGLVRYAADLMQAQVDSGLEVVALYPGGLSLLSAETEIISGESRAYQTYQIINSLPLAISGGLSEVKPFMMPTNAQIYKDFLAKVKPDVIHLHTLMGLHLEFLEEAKKQGIKLVFTSHDYFGLSPVPSFYYKGISYDENNSNEAWQVMSSSAYSVKKLRLFQSRFYPILRKFYHFLRPQLPPQDLASPQNLDYQALRDYYQKMFALIDSFHFNSELAKTVFLRNLVHSPKHSKVISITHGHIVPKEIDQPRRSGQLRRIAYIGPNEAYKGFDDFVHLADALSNSTDEFHTWGYVPSGKLPNHIIEHGRFVSDKLDEIYRQIDILIVPSKWKETFGFIVLEAIARGKTVLVSQEVGAKDLLPAEWIFKDLVDLKEKLQIGGIPQQTFSVKTLTQHVEELLELYER